MNNTLKIAAISGALAVSLGAFGAHGLKEMLTPAMLEIFKTGVQYQFYHTFALLAVGILQSLGESNQLKWASRLFVAGIIIFSGSLYLLSISGIKVLGAITPIGGIAFIAGWVMLFMHPIKQKQ